MKGCKVTNLSPTKIEKGSQMFEEQGLRLMEHDENPSKR